MTLEAAILRMVKDKEEKGKRELEQLSDSELVQKLFDEATHFQQTLKAFISED